MLTKQPLLAETVISAETASFGRKTCFGRITERGESRKAETETYFGRNFRPKPNRNSIRLTTTDFAHNFMGMRNGAKKTRMGDWEQYVDGKSN